MADKNQFKHAMADLREACHGQSEQLSLLSKVERYSGELRREKASLTRRIEELERAVTSKDGQIESLKPLTRLLDQIAELEKDKAKLEKERNDLRVVVKEWHEIEGDQSTFIKVKAKCMRCSLHFIVCTHRPEDHSSRTLICPECGQRKGQFLVWKETPADMFIFQSVPGETPLSEFGTPPTD
jgi:DNA-directed RNA polymerase subunit RPC12/RpoP